MTEDVSRQVVEFAVRAPSVHNTQPWRFVATATGLDLYADRSRQLAALDPGGRQLTISCGAALGMARLATCALGYSCTVELLPEEDLDHLARLTIGDPVSPPEDVVTLVRQAGRRRTVRDRFDPVPLTSAARTVLERETGEGGAWLQWLDSVPERIALAVLTDRADRIQQADPAFRAEIVRWRRPDETASDGIIPAALPELPGLLRASDVPLREFLPTRSDLADSADPQHRPMPAERPDLALVCTRHDGPTDWLRAGEALARVLLRAASLDIAASPLGQALDLSWTRRRLRTELALTGHPQVALRLGHAHLAGHPTPRRPLSEVLEIRR